jgi:hypothetical protein
MILLKLSLGIFFLRILVDKWQRMIVYLVVTLSSAFGIGYFFYAVFQCGIPNSGGFTFWEKKIEGRCYSSAQTVGPGDTHAVISTITDITLACLPITMLRKSRLPRREKLVVGGILAFAAV